MSNATGEYQFKPHERPTLPGSPASPDHPLGRRIAYLLIGALVGLTGGLGNALVSVNLTYIQGSLGLYSNEIAWLPTAYIMTNACMSLLLIKFRQQFGLLWFARIFLVLYVIATGAHLLVHTFASALLLRAISGVAASAMSTLGLLYSMQSMPPKWRLKGLVLGLGIPQLATPLARIFSSDLLEFGQWRTLYMFELGMAMLSLAGVTLLRLPPSERIKVFEKLDFLTFILFVGGVGLLSAVLGQGRILWWTEAAWLGYALCGAIVMLTLALWIEHHRKNPLLNTRWIGSVTIIRIAIVAVAMRVLLSEQTFGSVGLLQALGLNNDQMIDLFWVISLVTFLGVLLSALTLSPSNLGWPILVSIFLIMIGAWLDAHSNNLTRPAQMLISQSLLAFAAVFFLGPALLIGLTRALAQGPAYVVSFSALFGICQNIGGLLGSALLGTFQVVREKYWSHELVSALTLANPTFAARLQSSAGAYGKVIGDPTLRQAQGSALFAQQVTREANVLAFNDTFLLIGGLAALTLIWFGIHYVRYHRQLRQAAASSSTASPVTPVTIEPVTTDKVQNS
ncbi:MAG: proP [Verrucomicrobiaceae bacterium]|nr:proP [Verrucomicrobiaceae bacterium]